MRLVDSHAHLQAVRFAADADAVLAAARSAGVERVLVPGWDLASSRRALEIARATGVRAAAGIHPHAAADTDAGDEGWAAIRDLARDPLVCAVGETGLDYDRDRSPRGIQRANLGRHLELALEAGKPVIIHCRSARGERDAQDDLIAQLRAAGVGGGRWLARFAGRPPALLHSFSGPLDYAESALGMGLAVSFSGLAFRKGEEATADVARIVPEDRLLVETDAPYLPPPGAPRRRNEPQYVGITARWLAGQRGLDPEALGERLVANFDRILGGTGSERPAGAPG